MIDCPTVETARLLLRPLEEADLDGRDDRHKEQSQGGDAIPHGDEPRCARVDEVFCPGRFRRCAQRIPRLLLGLELVLVLHAVYQAARDRAFRVSCMLWHLARPAPAARGRLVVNRNASRPRRRSPVVCLQRGLPACAAVEMQSAPVALSPLARSRVRCVTTFSFWDLIKTCVLHDAETASH